MTVDILRNIPSIPDSTEDKGCILTLRGLL